MDNIEAALDKLTMLVQEIARRATFNQIYIDSNTSDPDYGSLTGVSDGVNVTYTVSEGSITWCMVFVQGQFQDPSQYSFVKATGVVTMGYAPASGNDVTIVYGK